MQHTYLRYECADAFALTTSTSSSSGSFSASPLSFLSLNNNNSNNTKTSTSSSGSVLLSAAGSQIVGFDLRTHEPMIKIAHRESLRGGLGSGRALNSNHVVCLTTCHTNAGTTESGSGGTSGNKVATGWVDGTVRIFDVTGDDCHALRGSKGSGSGKNASASIRLGMAHSIMFSRSTSQEEEFVTREPLLLNGHNGSTITALAFDGNGHGSAAGGSDGDGVTTTLASGSADGTVILWDILNETGLFRLLGHSGPISNLSFLPNRQSSSTNNSNHRTHASSFGASSFKGLVSSSHDGLVKVWDLNAQCCIQTIAHHGGQVLTSVVMTMMKSHDYGMNGDNDDDGDEGTKGQSQNLNRVRLITGCMDGKIRVYNIAKSKRMTMMQDDHKEEKQDSGEGTMEMTSSDATTTTTAAETISQPQTTTTINDDDVAFFMGCLPPPTATAMANYTPSHEKVMLVSYHPTANMVAYLRNNAKCIDVYKVRTIDETMQKKKRRLRRKREKEQKKKNQGSASASAPGGVLEQKKNKKRGLLDDDHEDDEANDDTKDQDPTSLMEQPDILDDIQASDEYEYVTTLRASHKIKSFAFAPHTEKKGGVRIVCALATNALEVHSISPNHNRSSAREDGENNDHDHNNNNKLAMTSKLVSSMDMYGHPTGIRSISLSSDDVLACTVSKNVAKVWNVQGRSCLRSLPLSITTTDTTSTTKKKKKKKSLKTYYGLCSVFLPGDTHIVVGTREGYILIVDVASGDIIYATRAHEKEIWSMDLRKPTQHDDSGVITLVTGSADKNVKFWEVETQENDDDSDDDDDGSDDDDNDDQNNLAGSHPGHPMVVHTRTLESSDDVVCVRYSYAKDPSKLMVFVSTLDCQIKVFFDDSLKFFLSLYGHTLPALAVDASDDDAILASGGADKSIKIWGLDFGDTHRTLYGHDDSITDLKFVRGTHNFFTSSKDGSMRYWDGDRFEQILLLNGHISEINCLAIARTGAFVLTGGMDRQVRVWERTKDMVFLEEEKERAMEDMFDKVDNRRGDEEGTAHIMRRRKNDEDQEEDDYEEDIANEPQSEAAVKRSVLSVSSGDRIMEALERADQEMKDAATFLKSQEGKGNNAKKRMPSPYLLGMEPPQYMLWVLRSVKSAELEQSLLVLPLNYMERLMYYLIVLLRNGQGVELCSRAAIFLVKTHQNQLIGHQRMSPPLRELRRLIKLRLAEARDTIGYNLAAIKIITKVSSEHKSRYHIPDEFGAKKDVFGGLGVGSDTAAALQRKY